MAAGPVFSDEDCTSGVIARNLGVSGDSDYAASVTSGAGSFGTTGGNLIRPSASRSERSA